MLKLVTYTVLRIASSGFTEFSLCQVRSFSNKILFWNIEHDTLLKITAEGIPIFPYKGMATDGDPSVVDAGTESSGAL